MPPQTDRERHTALDVKIEVLKVEVQGVKEAVSASIAETRRWRDEMKSDGGAMAMSFSSRFEKHEAQDEHKHAYVDAALMRLENETLAAGKMAIERIESLEKSQVAQVAIESYRKWLVATVVIGGGSVALNLLSALQVISFSIK
jgi:histidinol dehydrogenase